MYKYTVVYLSVLQRGHYVVCSFVQFQTVLLWTSLHGVLLSWDYRCRIATFKSVSLSTLLGIAESSNCVPYDTPTSCVWASISGDYCQKISFYNFFQSVEYKLYLIAVFTLHFLDYYWGWAFFPLCIYWPFEFSVTCLFLPLGPFFCWVVSFSHWLMGILFIFWILMICNYTYWKYHFLACGLSFSLFV